MATNKKEQIKEDIKKAGKTVKESAKETIKEVKKDTKIASNTAKEKSEVAKKAVKQTAKETKNAVKETAKETKKVAKKAAQKIATKEVYFEFGDKQVETSNLYDLAEKAYVATGKKASSIKSMKLYVKAEDNALYYVVNNKETGKVEL